MCASRESERAEAQADGLGDGLVGVWAGGSDGRLRSGRGEKRRRSRREEEQRRGEEREGRVAVAVEWCTTCPSLQSMHAMPCHLHEQWWEIGGRSMIRSSGGCARISSSCNHALPPSLLSTWGATRVPFACAGHSISLPSPLLCAPLPGCTQSAPTLASSCEHCNRQGRWHCYDDRYCCGCYVSIYLLPKLSGAGAAERPDAPRS